MSLYDDASLIMIPSGVKTGKVYSQKPMDSDGQFTFTRASEASRVNSAGLIEKVRTNSLLQSNSFDTAPFGGTRIHLTGGQADKDGGTDAWKLAANTTNSTHYIAQSVTISNGVACLSIYAKAGGYSYLTIRDDSTGSAYAKFDLATGVTDYLTSSQAVASSIESVGDGWYRCSMTFTETATGNILFYVNAAYDYANAYAGDGTSGIYIQSAQLEQGLVATDYIETTSVAVSEGPVANLPRLDYGGGATCPSLKLEPSRTNVVTHSQYIEAFISWSSAGTTITTNEGISPDGFQNATKFTGIAYAQFDTYLGYTASSTNTFSAFVKAGTSDTIQLIHSATGASATVTADLTNGTISSTSGAQYLDSSIVSYGNGWHRVSLTFTSGTTAYITRLAIMEAGSIYTYGWQIEKLQSYPTSLISTYGTAATRVADDMDTTFASAFATDGGATFFVEIDAAPATGINSTGQNLAFNFSSSDYMAYNHNGSGYHRIRVKAGGTSYYQSCKLQQGSRIKIAVKVSASSFSVFSNGSIDGSAVAISGDWASATDLITLINDNIGTIPLKQMLFFPTALTDSELETLTTL